MESIDEVKKYLSEQELNIKTDGDTGDKTLKCPSCRMPDFVHAGGQCELDAWHLVLTN
ncbi:MAG: hypothetical protein HW405_145 [Candidatus Berkelbacteria bacterium]|nr:hypothetical protein [Candidatus Berkelbacteria bacterium]